MSGFSEKYSAIVLEHITHKKETVSPTLWLALCTSVPTAASVGETIVEATYTGYARKELPAAKWNAATAGVPSSIKNGEAFTFAACTASSSTIVGWALCEHEKASEKGNVIMWGTAASTVISTTQTPASVASEVLVLQLQ